MRIGEHAQVTVRFLPACAGHRENSVENVWLRLKEQLTADRPYGDVDRLVAAAVDEICGAFVSTTRKRGPAVPFDDLLKDPAELARRAPVWAALAQLFVGTVLRPSDYSAVADALATSGYSLAELDRMLRDEVAPVFSANLTYSPTPEMFGWSTAGVRELVLAHLRRQRGLAGWLPTGWLRDRQVSVVREQWDAVRQLLSAPE